MKVNDGLERQLRTILSDQQTELAEVRAKRRRTLVGIGELDVKELELLLAIGQTKAQLDARGQ